MEAGCRDNSQWGSAPHPGILGGMAPVFDRYNKWPLTTVIAKGQVHYRRTVGLVIPCPVASPQSRTPFHQTSGV